MKQTNLREQNNKAMEKMCPGATDTNLHTPHATPAFNCRTLTPLPNNPELREAIQEVLDDVHVVTDETGLTLMRLHPDVAGRLLKLFHDTLLELVGEDESKAEWGSHEWAEVYGRNQLRAELRQKIRGNDAKS